MAGNTRTTSGTRRNTRIPHINSASITSFILLPTDSILRLLSTLITKLEITHQFRFVIGVFGTICAHIVEVWLFGLAFFLILKHSGFNRLESNFDGNLIDCVYFSFTNYTTLGYRDIELFGNIRFAAGIEAITGLSLSTWSASFMFMEMTQFWQDEQA